MLYFSEPGVRPRPGFLSIAAGLLAASLCHATTVFTNLGSTENGSVTLSSTLWVAAGFTTGSTSDSFADVLAYFSNPTGGNLSIDGGIYSDSSGSPGTELVAFASQTIDADTTATEFTFDATYQFAPSTNYWIVFSGSASGVHWDWVSGGPAPTASNGYSFDGYQDSTNTGGTWHSVTVGNPSIQMDVNLNTPEPGTLALLLPGLLLLGFGSYRHRARR